MSHIVSCLAESPTLNKDVFDDVRCVRRVLNPSSEPGSFDLDCKLAVRGDGALLLVVLAQVARGLYN